MRVILASLLEGKHELHQRILNDEINDKDAENMFYALTNTMGVTIIVHGEQGKVEHAKANAGEYPLIFLQKTRNQYCLLYTSKMIEFERNPNLQESDVEIYPFLSVRAKMQPVNVQHPHVVQNPPNRGFPTGAQNPGIQTGKLPTPGPPGNQVPSAGNQRPLPQGNQGLPIPGNQGLPNTGNQGLPIPGNQGLPIPGNQGLLNAGNQGLPIPGNQGLHIPGNQGLPIPGNQGPPIPGYQGLPNAGNQGPILKGNQGLPIPGNQGPILPNTKSPQVGSNSNPLPMQGSNTNPISLGPQLLKPPIPGVQVTSNIPIPNVPIPSNPGIPKTGMPSIQNSKWTIFRS